MKVFTPNKIAWLLPVTILIHQLEEYFTGFPIWYSGLLNAQLSNRDFVVINAIGLLVFTGFALSYYINENKLILAALGILIFVNGLIHIALTIFTFSYSPGTVSGVVLFIPLGIIIFRRIFPHMKYGEKNLAIIIGIGVLFIVSMIAMNI